MVARLSVGKPGMEAEAYYEDVVSAATALSKALFDGGRADSQAFEAVRSAYGLAKTTEEEKTERSRAIQAAWTHAARVPLENARRCARVLELGTRLQGRSNPNAASDLVCAMHLARAGLLGCVANVEINMPSIKDPSEVAELVNRVDALREQAEVYVPSLEEP
jgi:formiminotetrahydrofolate cyclodeaminase